MPSLDTDSSRSPGSISTLTAKNSGPHGADTLQHARLSGSSDECRAQIKIALSAYRSIMGDLTYVSMPITSGARLYDVSRELGVPVENIRADRELLFQEVIQPNLAAGVKVASQVALGGRSPVIAPSIFEAKDPRWSQDEYMAMWLSMIEEKVGCLVMMDGWALSDGGAEEYLHGVQMRGGFRSRNNLELVDQRGEKIGFSDGLDRVAEALVCLHDSKQKSPRLADVYSRLIRVHAFYTTDMPPGKYEGLSPKADFFDWQCSRVDRILSDLDSLMREDYGKCASCFAPHRSFITEKWGSLIRSTQVVLPV